MFTFSQDSKECDKNDQLLKLDVPSEFESFADYMAKPPSAKEAQIYFQKIVENRNPQDFGKDYLDMAKKHLGDNAEFATVKKEHYYFEVVYDKSDRGKTDNDDDLTRRSYTRKVWVKKDNTGNVLEVGSSEI